MNTRSAAPCTLSHGEGLPSFRVPCPLADPITAPAMFMHLPNPCLIAKNNSLASVTHMLNPVEEEYHRTLQLMPLMPQDTPQVPGPPASVAPQLQPTYIPHWPPVPLG